MSSTRLRASAIVGLLAFLGSTLLAPVAVAEPQRSTVKPRISLAVDKTEVPRGKRVVLTGAVRRVHPKPVIRIQRSVGGRKWVNVAKVRLGKAKRFRVAQPVRHKSTRFRVKVFRKGKYKASVSRVVRVRGVATPSTPPPGSGPGAGSEPEVAAAVQQILSDTNAFRAENGKPPLQLHPEITQVAQAWSTHMATNDVFFHNPDYAAQYPPGWTMAGENIAAGYAVDAVVTGWINSAGHRANMLADYTHIGIGVAWDSKSSFGVYYTQNFARYP